MNQDLLVLAGLDKGAREKLCCSVPNTASLPNCIPLYTVLNEGLVPSVHLRVSTSAGAVAVLANSLEIRGIRRSATPLADLDGSG